MSPLDYLAPFALILLLVAAFVLVVEWYELTPKWRAAIALVCVVLAVVLSVWSQVDCSGSWQECTR